jgi:hypothetical protein
MLSTWFSANAFFRDVAADADPARRWTGFNKMFGGSLYKGFEEVVEEEEKDKDLQGGL